MELLIAYLILTPLLCYKVYQHEQIEKLKNNPYVEIMKEEIIEQP